MFLEGAFQTEKKCAINLWLIIINYGNLCDESWVIHCLTNDNFIPTQTKA